MNSVLITGGAGFIGRYTVDAFLAAGYRVKVLDRVTNPFSADSSVEYIQADICDFDACANSVGDVDGIVHLAAMSRSGPSIDAWEDCLQSNILGTANLLKAASSKQVTKFVYAASATYYGQNQAPNRIGDVPDFLNFYALSKATGEDLALQFDRHFNLHVTPLRYFSVYGDGQPTDGPYGLVMGIFLKLKAEGKPAVIFGDGKQRRDFIHVRDIAAANLAAFESNFHGRSLNVGSGLNYSIIELAEIIGLDYTHGPKRAGDAFETLADIQDTTDALSWKPLISLHDGIGELLRSSSAS